ncbi:Transcriptional activator RfaH [hydrothermal vent metagenome]|uniref:Transcriptional activator RfaH n=1 Tax=hydrothermal vent metagenome TaxID=652676 RepID=A0A1W1CNQ5_9ZZZZ
MKNWYLLQTKPNQENKAILNLENQSFCIYQAKHIVRKRIKNKWKNIEVSLFPNYLFIQLDAKKDNWNVVNSTLGVSRFVRFGTAEQFKKGDKVIISNDIFKDIEVIFQEKKNDNRILVLFNLLGKNNLVKVNEDDLKVCKD